MEEEGGRKCCNYLWTFFFTVCITTCIVLWVELSPQKPKCSIQFFYVPALNKSLDANLDKAALPCTFMLRLDNPNVQGIYYDDVNVSLSSKNASSLVLVNNYIVPRFYQGRKKKANKMGQVLPLNNHTVLSNGSSVFRLDLKTRVRFKVVFWTTKRYGVEVGADVEVGGDGFKADYNGIKMKKSDSSPPPLRNSVLICVLMNLFILLAIL